MAHSKSAKKRVSQNEKRRQRNKSVKSTMRTHVKHVEEAIEAGDREAAERALRIATTKLDKAARRNIIHRNQAARRKSRLQKAVSRIQKS